MTDVLSVSRRGFLRSAGRGHRAAIRPPWALAEQAFTASCTRCDACVEHCSPAILIRGDGGFPEVDFSRGECTFCAECLLHCEPAALQRTRPDVLPWQLRVEIGTDCLAMQGVECRVCGENCPETAIRFRPRLGGVALPELDAQCCSACGACVAPCPSRAITITHSPQPTMESMA
ncbi:MAG: ferredoxin-type protein NapF [Thauera sp.]|jgi:ferredoxin-type protein NapF|nr:ferredoxin-type protein NapF [Thauera sp.]